MKQEYVEEPKFKEFFSTNCEYKNQMIRIQNSESIWSIDDLRDKVRGLFTARGYTYEKANDIILENYEIFYKVKDKCKKILNIAL